MKPAFGIFRWLVPSDNCQRMFYSRSIVCLKKNCICPGYVSIVPLSSMTNWANTFADLIYFGENVEPYTSAPILKRPYLLTCGRTTIESNDEI